MVSSPGVGGDGEGDMGSAIGTSPGVAADEEDDDEGGEDGGGRGKGCFCGDGVSSFSEIEAGDEGRDKDAIGEASASDSSALGVALGVALSLGVNATGVPKDDKEDVGEDSVAAGAGAGAPVNKGGGGGISAPNTLGSVGNSPKSGNTGN